jgi:outer membrane protein OmpA-like peptidoglycan-associated protein
MVTRRGRNLDLSTDVLFGRGSDRLTSGAMLAISTVADVLREQLGGGTVKVNGYTDDEGSQAFNLKLSRERAIAVANALREVYRGDLELRPRGYGEAHPVGDNGTVKGRAKNRRVTIVLPKPCSTASATATPCA